MVPVIEARYPSEVQPELHPSYNFSDLDTNPHWTLLYLSMEASIGWAGETDAFAVRGPRGVLFRTSTDLRLSIL